MQALSLQVPPAAAWLPEAAAVLRTALCNNVVKLEHKQLVLFFVNAFVIAVVPSTALVLIVAAVVVAVVGVAVAAAALAVTLHCIILRLVFSRGGDPAKPFELLFRIHCHRSSCIISLLVCGFALGTWIEHTENLEYRSYLYAVNRTGGNYYGPAKMRVLYAGAEKKSRC